MDLLELGERLGVLAPRLELLPVDQAAWRELAEMHELVGNAAEARFCRVVAGDGAQVPGEDGS